MTQSAMNSTLLMEEWMNGDLPVVPDESNIVWHSKVAYKIHVMLHSVSSKGKKSTIEF